MTDDLKIGDRFDLTFEVTIDELAILVGDPGEFGGWVFPMKSCLDGFRRNIVRKPVEPKVGDTVWCVERPGPYNGGPYGGSTLIHIHQDPEDISKRKWGVIAFKGDIPRSVYLEDLRLKTP